MLELRHTPSATLLASAPLDLLPLGLGEQSFSLPTLELAPEEVEAAAVEAPPAVPGKRGGSGRGPAAPPPAPRLAAPPVLQGLSVALTRREAPEGVAPEPSLTQVRW